MAMFKFLTLTVTLLLATVPNGVFSETFSNFQRQTTGICEAYKNSYDGNGVYSTESCYNVCNGRSDCFGFCYNGREDLCTIYTFTADDGATDHSDYHNYYCYCDAKSYTEAVTECAAKNLRLYMPQTLQETTINFFLSRMWMNASGWNSWANADQTDLINTCPAWNYCAQDTINSRDCVEELPYCCQDVPASAGCTGAIEGDGEHGCEECYFRDSSP